MKTLTQTIAKSFSSRAAFAVLILSLLGPTTARAQLVSSGLAVQNPDWEILITDFGYADLALDRRAGFLGREFLSGEWAAAVFYSGGSNPTGPVWFQPQWFFPDWVSNSDFLVEKKVGIADPFNPKNADGFLVFQSVIANKDLRVTMTYEMLDSKTGIEQGTAPASTGGPGAKLTSNRYVYRQTYKIENISGAPLANLKFYQFLHGLQTATSVYDNRDYGGTMGEYRYDNTQQGDVYSFDTRSGEIVQHSDTLCFHAKMTPSAWEVGYYGKRPTDDHVIGKPSVGVHLSVERDDLSGLDLFDPPEDRWVSGAQRFELGTLAPGAMTTIDVLLTIQTSFVVKFAGVNIRAHKFEFKDKKFIIHFRETIGGPVGFILRTSADLQKTPFSSWEQVPVPYNFDPRKPGEFWFEAPDDPPAPRKFFLIQPVLN
ncbi:MAG: hypothetical protein HYY24_14950 [Verrucomicrobia bacterium]|nr:hypothetical protein [Verrucomicrobiota bacterium]